MLTYTITGDNVALSEKVRSYIEKRFKNFSRFASGEHSPEIIVTVSKSTVHQREDSTKVEVKFKLHPQEFFVSGEAHDIMAAIDQAKAELMREVTQSKSKRITLFHRGARKLKSLMRKGFGGKN